MYKQCFKDKVNQRFNNNSIIARKNSFLFENSEENISNSNKNNFKNLKLLLNKNLNEDYIFSRNNNTEKYIYPLTALTSSNNQLINSNNYYSNNNFIMSPKEQILKELNKLKVSNYSNRFKVSNFNNNNFNNNNSLKYDLNKIQFDSKIEQFKKEIKKDYTINKDCVLIRDDNIKNQCLNKLYPITNKIDNLLNSPKRSLIKSFSNKNLSNNKNSKRYFYNDYQNNTHFKFINFFNNNNKNKPNYQYDNLKKLYLKKNKSFYN